MSSTSTETGNVPLANSRHELFAQSVADGKTATDAYRGVYNCKGGNNTARVGGAKLLTYPLVRARVDYLKAQNAAVKALSREQKRLILAEIAMNAKDDRARIQAIQEDNRMTGDSEDKLNVKGGFNLTWK